MAQGVVGDRVLRTRRAIPLIVVVAGIPGSGKTTLARALSAELNLPLLSKDDAVQHALGQSHGQHHHKGNRGESRLHGWVEG